MPYVYVWLSVTAYGALMEILQHFCTVTRSGEMADLYADMIGALAGVALVAMFKIINRKS
jgi:VanZ family protein